MARISVASAKAKGRNLQKWMCQMIAQHFDFDNGSKADKAIFTWGYGDDCDIQPRLMGQSGVDIILRGEIAKLFPFSIECKSGQNIGWQAAVEQARANQKPGTYWMVVLKTKKFKNPIIMLDANDFFEYINPLEEPK